MTSSACRPAAPGGCVKTIRHRSPPWAGPFGSRLDECRAARGCGDVREHARRSIAGNADKPPKSRERRSASAPALGHGRERRDAPALPRSNLARQLDQGGPRRCPSAARLRLRRDDRRPASPGPTRSSRHRPSEQRSAGIMVVALAPRSSPPSAPRRLVCEQLDAVAELGRALVRAACVAVPSRTSLKVSSAPNAIEARA